MAIYSFNVRKHIRDDMYNSQFVEVELSDQEYRDINNDDEKYSKTSALVSRKLGENLQAQGFPSKINTGNTNASKEKQGKEKKKSFWKPWWAIPFKFIWWLIKLPFKLFF